MEISTFLSLGLHEKSLDLSNYEIFPHKILKSRTFKKSSILIVIIEPWLCYVSSISTDAEAAVNIPVNGQYCDGAPKYCCFGSARHIKHMVPFFALTVKTGFCRLKSEGPLNLCENISDCLHIRDALHATTLAPPPPPFSGWTIPFRGTLVQNVQCTWTSR
jgi:hypothetical protein